MLLEKANKLLEQNKLREAEFHYKTLLNSEPENGDALFGLGRIALRLERYDAAVYLLQHACHYLPNMLEPLHALADAFNSINSPNDALRILKHATSLTHNNPDPYYHLAQQYLTYGDLDKAHATFSQALRMGLYPVTAFILLEIVQLGRFNKEHNYISDLHYLLTHTNNLRLKIVIYYALAKSYDLLNDIDQAFTYFELANKLQLKLSEFNTTVFDSYYTNIIDYTPSAVIKDSELEKNISFTPVFIVGIARSGLTLLEQILCSHTQYASFTNNRSVIKNVIVFLEHQTATDYPQCLFKLTPQLIKKARNMYIEAIKKVQSITPFIINKSSDNHVSLGLIYILFPNAKFINITRDFNATAFSIFSHYFTDNEPYYCSLTEFKHYYKLYEKLIKHWDSVGLPIYNIPYEELVSNPKEQLIQLFKFLGCNYQQRCLSFYKYKHAVNTLNKQAIRHPLNDGAIAKWERYKTPFLKLMSQN